ncbi:MAG: dihydrolipoyl dehydrogenase [Thermoplasmata archaeon]|nr:MAG: dihydrolipoyl dehydrogenase [Thermoplasmata archaeon]
MPHYDVLIIGSGVGYKLATKTAKKGLRTALVDRDPPGGTCPNRGCIPSKIWITVADKVREAEALTPLGVEMYAESVDFCTIRERTLDWIKEGQAYKRSMLAGNPHIDFYEGEVAHFTGTRTLQVGDVELTADKVVIASGSRPSIPPVEGLEEAGYLTNRNVFEIERLPGSIVIIGGGFIAAEFAHFFSALGSQVTLLGRNPRLVPKADEDVSEAILKGLSRYVDIRTDHEVLSVATEGGLKIVTARDRVSGNEVKFPAQEIMVAAGRRSNADLLRPEATGVELDDRGWVVTDHHLATNVEGIWAMGDAVNRGQYRHTADMHQRIVYINAFTDDHRHLDEHAIPNAVFTWPQVGAVGMTEWEAKEAGIHYHHARMMYSDVSKGYALGDEDGFIKVLVEEGTERILGAHMVGPESATLIQQIVTIMNAGEGTFEPFKWTQVIHPTLSEVVNWVFLNLDHPEDDPFNEMGEHVVASR